MSVRQADDKFSYDSLADMRSRLDQLGTLANQNRMANVPNTVPAASAGYVQADQQALIDLVDAILKGLQRSGIMAPAK